MSSELAPQRQQLFVNGRFLTQPLSGVQRFATEITSAMIRQRPDILVLVPSGDPVEMPNAQVVGRRAGVAWEQLDLPHHVRGNVLINLGNTGPLRLRSQVVVIHDAGVHATPEAYSWQFRAYYRTAQWWLKRQGVTIATVSEFARQQLLHYLGADPDNVSVVSEGADHMDALRPDPAIMTQVPFARFVLVVGNLAAHKNLAALSDLAEQLAGRGVGLVITGGLAAGAFRASGRLPQPAHYLGRVSDAALKTLYQHAACLVFPSRYEGFGLPAVEAMACGCPVIAARIPALMEVCGDAALYCDPASPADIAATTVRLLDDPGLERRLRESGPVHAGRYTWNSAARRLLDVADRCARGGVSDRPVMTAR